VGKIYRGLIKVKIDVFFQKGFYINLDRRPDRKEQFEKEMEEAGLKGFFERVPGIDSISEPDVLKRHNYCGQTFHELFKKIDQEGLERVVIFEDDASFYNKGQIPGLNLVESGLDQLLTFSDWDIVYFGGYVFDNPAIKVSENLLKVKTILTCHAIGINKNGLKKILKYRPFVDCPIDGWLGEQHNIIKYLVYPLAVLQRNSKSDLDANNWSPETHHWENSYSRINIKNV